jgi:hypothetical protein
LKDGLTNSSIYCVTQDPQGFIYGGTSDGVFRFDGIRFEKLCGPFDSSRSLGHITGMIYDSINQEVLIASYTGFYGYNVMSDTMRQLDKDVVYDLEKDLSNGQYYYVSRNESSNFIKLWHAKENSLVVIRDNKDDWMREVVRNPKNPDEWYIANKSIKCYHAVNKETKIIKDMQSLKGVETRFDDLKIRNQKLFAASIGLGVLEIDLESGKIKDYCYAAKTSARFNMVRHLLFLSDSLISVSTSDRGIGTLNLYSGKYSFYVHDPKDPTSISLISGRSTFYDKTGNLWACMAESLSLKSTTNNAFKIDIQKTPPTFLWRELDARNAIFVMDSLILQGNNKTIFVYDKEGNVLPNPFEMPKKEFGIIQFAPYKEKKLLGYNRHSIYEIDLVQFKITKLLGTEDLVNDWGFTDDRIFGVHVKGDTMIVHSFNEFVFGSLVEKKMFDKPLKFSDDLIVQSLLYDGALYFLGQKGLYKLYNHKKIERISELSDLIFEKGYDVSMSASKHGILFTSLTQGAILYNPSKEDYLTVNISNGTKTNKLAKGVVDEEGNIWLTSPSGLHLYNAHYKTVVVFDKRDNLWSNDLLPDYINILGDRVGISVDIALNSWSPKEMNLSASTDSIQLISVNGVKCFRHIYPSETEKLNIRFSNFKYGQRKGLNYFYQLNNTTWELMNDDGNLDLIALGAGKYNLQLKVIDKFGRVGYSPVFSFRIARSWYTTWWFYVLLGISIACIAYVIFYKIKSAHREVEKVQNTYKQIAKELENQVMRSQMNPHFLFNSMNSIRYYILSNETTIAANYLTKFSRLIRNILENSRKDTLSLKEEIDTISLYVELERLRFDNKFDFNLEIEQNIQLSSVFLPPMIIQPFLENAILHGINPKVEHSTLSLFIYMKEYLEIVIIDDGIGRAAASKLKTNNSLRKESLGQHITERRLELLTDSIEKKIEITDLNPGEKYPGTKVIIRIPLEYSSNL